MITADFGIIPIGIEDNNNISKYVTAAVKSIKESGLNYELTGMGTQIEAQTLDELYEAVKKAQEEVFKCGSERVYTVLKIDDRRDRNRSLKDKIKTVNDSI
ncbi:MTH1187 family thiamine-binding protein [Methanobrevibacter sp. OttesenSCG-928-K11]|nr:MTH1187 family thiamine-binding protein [Methanobrevibacter sp. OttesenSCG-928-K11]MDL2271132.1 MTH1187 family thiamine-binding protein [Methanobrevibacter sp. OttesenSCG-928-I08]